jgi:hypothetical protein
MTIIFILAGIAILLITFFSGYNLALRNEQIRYMELGHESDSMEPIFARLDREWKYTDDLNRPFDDVK